MVKLASPLRVPQGPVSSVPDRCRYTRANRLRNNVFVLAFALLLFCHAFNFRLHSNISAAVTYSSDQIPSDAVVKRLKVIVDDEGDGDANASTASPMAATSSPTTATASLVSSEQTQENEQLHHDERPAARPRVACFIHHDTSNGNARIKTSNNTVQPEVVHKWTSCSSVGIISPKTTKRLHSIPLDAPSFRGDKVEVGTEATTCKYPNSTHHAESFPPPTCNDIHSLGLDAHIFQNQRYQSTADRASIKYMTMGGAKCIWKVNSTLNGKDEETVIFKSHKNAHFWKPQFYDQNRRDALIGGTGSNQLARAIESKTGIPGNGQSWNHIVPMHQYCALASIVPYAQGNLAEYVLNKDGESDKNQRIFGPMDTLRLALQAARGLYQAQLYWDGKPTFVHADINPSQFLVFLPHSNKLPILQINDFNQGRFLTRSVSNNKTCPFQDCSKNLGGGRYHPPEQFTKCIDQDAGIDTFSLGGVFFFLLTNGFHPYYNTKNFYRVIRNGELPHIPQRLDLDHPAYDALQDVMIKCMTSKLIDRPSSLEVVHMLEEKLQQVKRKTESP